MHDLASLVRDNSELHKKVDVCFNALESELSSLLDEEKIKSLITDAWCDGDKNSQDKFGDFLDRAVKAICQSFKPVCSECDGTGKKSYKKNYGVTEIYQCPFCNGTGLKGK